MKKALLSVVWFFVVSLIIFPVVGREDFPLENYKILKHLSGNFENKLWNNQIILESELRDVMKQLSLKEGVDTAKASFGAEQFNKTFEMQCAKFHHGSFQYFACLCKTVYEKSNDRDKILIFEIFKNAIEYMREIFVRIQRRNDNELFGIDLDWALKSVIDYTNQTQSFGTSESTSVLPDQSSTTPIPSCEWFCDKAKLDGIVASLHQRMRTDTIPIPQETILSSLTFLRKVEEGQKTNVSSKFYAKPKAFQNSYEEIVVKLRGERYSKFAITCLAMYEELKEAQDKMALYILFLSISRKENEFLTARQISRRLAEMREDSYPFLPNN